MKFKGMLLMLVAIFVMALPAKSEAVGEEVCAAVTSILSKVPGSVGYLDGFKIKCKLSGCKTYYKCRSLEIGDQLEFGLTMICNALTMYGPGFFPGSPFAEMNADLLNIDSQLGNLGSMVGGPGIESTVMEGILGDIEGSLGSIQSMLPTMPAESSRWVRKKSQCKVDTGDAEAAMNEEAAVAETAEDDPFGCADGVVDVDTGDVADECEGDDEFSSLEGDAAADYQAQLDADIASACVDPDAPDYDDCVAAVTAVFVYTPTSDIEDATADATADAATDGMTEEEIADLVDEGTAGCISAEVAATLPDTIEIPPEQICP